MARAAILRIPDYFLYGEAPRQVAERFLHVETIEARSARHHWKIDPHLHHSLHQVLLVSHGRGVASAEGAVSHFRPPALTFVPAETVHGFEFEPGTLGFVVTFSEGLLRDLMARESALTRLFITPLTLEMPERSPATIALMRAVRGLAHEHVQASPGRMLALEGWLSIVLASAMGVSQALTQSTSASLWRSRQLVARFRALIESGFRSSHTIPDYARALRASESRLRNACLTATGQPPIQLLHTRILLEAKRQLVYTVMPVAEIAYRLGFDDPAYFSRFFTRRAGVSPRAYRSRGAELTTAE
ncbi:MAG: helix-turn-helix domain-containing protein [Steroidobacteraceae bacterium]